LVAHGSLKITHGEGVVTLNIGAQNLTVTSNITGTGNLTMAGGNLTISGSFTNSGTFTPGSGTVTYAGAAQTIKLATYNNLTLSGSNTKTLGGAITVNGNLTVSAGTLATSTYQITGNATGTFSMASGTSFTIGNIGSATNVNFPTLFTNGHISFASGTTVTYQANTSQTISSTPNYQNLTINTFSGTKSANGTLTVQGNLVTTSPCTLGMTTYTLNLTGNYTGTGGLSFSTGAFNIGGSFTNSGTFTCGTGTTTYNSSSASQTVAAATYYNAVFSNAGTKTLGGAIVVNNNLTISNNLDVSASNYSIQVKKGWTNNGSFNARSGTVTFNGASAQTLSGSGTTAFYALTISNTTGVSITSGTYTLADALTLSNGTFATGGNSFTMLSTTSKTARIAPVAGTGAVSGNFTIQRCIPARASVTWACLASPVVSTTFADWDSELFFDYTHNGSTIWSNVLKYSESAADYVAVTSGTTISNGEGVEVYLSDDVSLSGLSLTYLTSVGVPYTGTKNISLSYTPAASPYEGQNLVGNPFASSIQVNGITFNNALSSVDVYDNVSNSYITLSGTDELAPHQGFWAYATSAVSSLSIPESAKTTTTTGTIKSATIGEFLKLTISSADGSHTNAHSLKIAATNDALDGWDLKDHPFRKSPCKEAPFITTNCEKFPLSISTFNSNNDEYVMPLNVGVGIAGKYQITAQGISNIQEDYSCVLLEDKVLNKWIDLNNQNNYTFFFSPSDNTNRFVLHFSKDNSCKAPVSSIATDIQDAILVTQTLTGNLILFNLEEETDAIISVNNLLGQTIVEPIKITAKQQSQSIDLPSDFHGIYFIKITTSSGDLVKKIYR